MSDEAKVPGAGSYFKIPDPGDSYDPDLETHCIGTPFFAYLLRLELGARRYFDSSLSLSLVRAFGLYQRIMELENGENFSEGRPELCLFMDSDIENFIIRHRIILNDFASILHHLYPSDVRGLPGPRGNVHPRDRELSIWDLEKYCKSNPDFHLELLKMITKNRKWLNDLRRQRDRLVHYKANVMVIRHEDGRREFFIVSPGSDLGISEDGSSQSVDVPVFSFVHTQMESLWRFMNEDLVEAMREYAERKQLPLVPPLGVHGFSAYGVEIFKKNRGRFADKFIEVA